MYNWVTHQIKTYRLRGKDVKYYFLYGLYVLILCNGDHSDKQVRMQNKSNSIIYNANTKIRK